MTVKDFKYSLAKRGKWICPKCFSEHRSLCDTVTFHRPAPVYRPMPRPSYVDGGLFKQSVMATANHGNHLITYLNGLFYSTTVDKMIADYYIGTSKHWPCSTVFWQVDRYGRVHAGKIMQYNPHTGKRIKEPRSRITWVHSAMSITDFKLSQCLFGEHLLNKHPNKIVAIVESEKTAIILSGVLVGSVVLACGGCGNLTPQMCEPLRGREVVLLPDNGKFSEWYEKGKQMRHIFSRLFIADIMEREATQKGDDIADLIVQCNHDISALDCDLLEI